MINKNLLFICVDCLRADKTFHPEIELPAISSLINKGTSFTKTFSTATTTSPTISSIFTGTYPFHSGIMSLAGYKLNPSIKTMAEILKENGYHTCAFVTGPLTKEFGLERGFDRYEYRDKKHNLHSQYLNEFLDQINSLPKPWFSFLHLWEIHGPRSIPRKYNKPKYGKSPYTRALYALDKKLQVILENVDLDQTIVVLTGDHGESIAEGLIKRSFLKLRKKPLTKELIPIIGKTIDKARPSLPFLFNIPDHYAPGYRDQFIGHGHHVYDYLSNIPLIFAGEKIFPKKAKISSLTSQVDILPTLLDALKINPKLKYELDGVNLMPSIYNKESLDKERSVYIQASGKRLKDQSSWLAGLRTDQWKYAYTFKNKEKSKHYLFDLNKDPFELKNIVDRKPQLAKKMRKNIDEKLKDLKQNKMTNQEEAKINERLKDLGYL